MADLQNPTLVSPFNGAWAIGNVLVFGFEIPIDTKNVSGYGIGPYFGLYKWLENVTRIVFCVELDTNVSISQSSPRYKINESRLSLDNKSSGKWEVKDASGNWIAMPSGGVDSSFYGRDARVTIRRQDTPQYPDTEGHWYWRIGASDGSLRNPVYNRVVFAQAIFGDTGGY